MAFKIQGLPARANVKKMKKSSSVILNALNYKNKSPERPTKLLKRLKIAIIKRLRMQKNCERTGKRSADCRVIKILCRK